MAKPKIDSGPIRTYGSCICPIPARKSDGSYDWNIDPECSYHRAAAANPSNHSIPWNCPTFWDGCNCKQTIKDLRAEIERLKNA